MEREKKFNILRGIIAGSFLTNETKEELIDFVTDYEDAEENGMLIHLPCRVGDTVYLIDHNICRNRKKPLKCIIDEFTVDHSNECYAVLNGSGKAYYAMRRFRAVNIKDFGKTVFLTSEAAEQALKQMGEKK